MYGDALVSPGPLGDEMYGDALVRPGPLGAEEMYGTSELDSSFARSFLRR